MATNVSPELLIVMKGGATAEQTENVVARLQEVGVDARVSRGREATVIGAIGELELLTSLPTRGVPGRGAGAAHPQAVQARVAGDLARPDGDRGRAAARSATAGSA